MTKPTQYIPYIVATTVLGADGHYRTALVPIANSMVYRTYAAISTDSIPVPAGAVAALFQGSNTITYTVDGSAPTATRGLTPSATSTGVMPVLPGSTLNLNVSVATATFFCVQFYESV